MLNKSILSAAVLTVFVGLGSAAEAATFIVDRTDDTAAATACTAAANDCSLRGAVIASNTAGGSNVITLPAGTYTLTLAGTCENGAATGDLDIINGAVGSDVTINGAGAATTIINGNDIDRVFHLPAITVASTLTLNDVTVRNGTAAGCTAFDAHGGGIRIDMGTVNLTRVVMSDNVAPDGNGGGISNSGTLNITESTIGAGNTSSVNGGGISNITTNFKMINSTVSGNTATGSGGGIASSDPGDLRNVTVTNNTANGKNGGGGVFTTTDTPGLTIRNTIIAGNTAPGATADDCGFNISGGVVTSEGYNLIGDGTGCLFSPIAGDQVGTGLSPIDPALGSLTDNGGPTPTHALLTTPLVSPAIDAANPAGCFSDDANSGGLLTTDQRSRTRPLDGGIAGPSPAQCDIGAFELGGCGDGFVDVGEDCDDGNVAAGDGCSATCTVESGYSCKQAAITSPSVCQKGCGDGVVSGTEECDDGNVVDGDGCSSTCTVEPGYDCTITSTSVCTLTSCGDGVLQAGEQCDDGNNTSGDGCSSSCIVETSFACTDKSGATSVCTAGCGDGVVAGSEECDDGDNTDGDGCSSICRVETGFVCTGAPSSCKGVIYILGSGCSLIR